MKDDVVGWLLAWLPEGGVNFNFEFFQEKGTLGELCKYSWVGTSKTEDWDLVEVPANCRAHYELELLLSKKVQKLGVNVISGYVKPVIAHITE